MGRREVVMRINRLPDCMWNAVVVARPVHSLKNAAWSMTWHGRYSLRAETSFFPFLSRRRLRAAAQFRIDGGCN
jgi:hypothetical protein